ncbi:phosphoglucomutase/phosphomannomutase family protein [Proteiniclasticum ruminis]|uniref:Phosphoglucomutase n=1 Tax=Proteiniclasticum ruminis TaxID=398199 RepID=A0A1I5BXE8_9CLOT|nr:phosphoglucomutase/phosphomannomutase family protein [Proteiniclasticum ruminis]SFN79367.1 Phosphomannomutase [Proteiniclasticum ruminis]
MIQFGTGGWRDIIGDGFIKDNIVLVAQALANLMKEEKVDSHGIVIGYDKRFLSDKASRWIAEVFAGNGIAVNFIEKVSPTPLIMYTVKSFACDYGLAVTASHNPADYNGIKIFTKGGKDADLSVTKKLEEILKGLSADQVKTLKFQEGKDKGVIRSVSPFNDYVDAIISMLDKEAIRNRELKVLVDPMYGVSKAALQTVLITVRCEVDVINDRHDTSFGGRMPSPTKETLGKLRDMVKAGNYDIGIGTDGDADRLGIIDEEGNYVTSNDIMALLYYYLLNYKGMKGPVVRNLSTTHLLDRIAEDFGETCYEVPVGFKYISGKMLETDAIIGGESSGGLTIKGHIKGKDGIFAAALLVEMISVTGKRIHEMLKDLQEKYGAFHMHEENLALTEEEERSLKLRLFEEKEVPHFTEAVKTVSYQDGLKLYFDNGGWLVARFSGTEKLLRVFTEMGTLREAKQIAGEFLGHFGIDG